MADEQEQSRRGKLRELRQKRQAQPGYEGNRTGLKGLWADMAESGEKKAGPKKKGLKKRAPAAKKKSAARKTLGGAGGEAGPGGPLLRNLLQNQKVRQTLVGWLGQGAIGAGTGVTSGVGQSGESNDFGLERLSKEEQITSSSTPEEIARYRRQLENRADWLEAALEETLMELDRIGQAVTGKPAGRKKAAAKKKVSAKQAPAKKVAVKKKAARRGAAKS